LPLLFMLLRKSCFSFNSKCHLIVIHFWCFCRLRT
jgi:hypothetical protein